MPVAPTYPGVYIEEIPSGIRTITGVATSITAFIGRAQRGPVNEPITINSYADFERIFGGLWVDSTLGFAVRDFYLNGGSQSIIVRLYGQQQVISGGTTTVPPAGSVTKAQFSVATQNGSEKRLELEAAYEGAWGNLLRIRVDHQVRNEVLETTFKDFNVTEADLFNLTIRDTQTGVTEIFRNLTVTDSPRTVNKILENESRLMRVLGELPDGRPLVHEEPVVSGYKILDDGYLFNVGNFIPDDLTPPIKVPLDFRAKHAQLGTDIPAETELTIAAEVENRKWKIEFSIEIEGEGQAYVYFATRDSTDLALLGVYAVLSTPDVLASDGSPLKGEDFTGDGKQAGKKGMYALEKADLFNLLCIPPFESEGDIDYTLVDTATKYCQDRRAMFLIDPPKKWGTKKLAVDNVSSDLGAPSKNSAIFFPRLQQPNPVEDNQIQEFVPCGAVAGIFARTDTQRGVWKAPAGLEATLIGVPQLTVNLTDPEIGELNPLGINCLRVAPPVGRVVWGARTREGDDRLGSEWKYIPVRRTALFIEESLYRGTQWVVFEPNDEPLWAQIRLNVGAFMNNLFRQGAFQGTTPHDAYFVKCDSETTTQNDINLGIVNVVVGFAPLKPAEFVIIKLQQMAGQIEV